MSNPQSISLRTVLLGTLVVLLAMGVRATFGLFMQPMGLAHGWGRDVFSMAFALQNLVWGAASILMGMLADRYGSGRTVALGALLYVAGMIGTRFATDELSLYLSAGLLVGLGQAGTTLPELITCMVAAVKREGDIAIGNIVGSNIFNLLGVLGIAGVLAPIGTTGVQTAEVWGAVALAALSLPVMWRGLIVNRAEGALLVAAYLVYLALVWRG